MTKVCSVLRLGDKLLLGCGEPSNEKNGPRRRDLSAHSKPSAEHKDTGHTNAFYHVLLAASKFHVRDGIQNFLNLSSTGRGPDLARLVVPFRG